MFWLWLWRQELCHFHFRELWLRFKNKNNRFCQGGRDIGLPHCDLSSFVCSKESVIVKFTRHQLLTHTHIWNQSVGAAACTAPWTMKWMLRYLYDEIWPAKANYDTTAASQGCCTSNWTMPKLYLSFPYWMCSVCVLTCSHCMVCSHIICSLEVGGV